MKNIFIITVCLTIFGEVCCQTIAMHTAYTKQVTKKCSTSTTKATAVCVCPQDPIIESTLDEARILFVNTLWNRISPTLDGLQIEMKNVVLDIMASSYSHEEVFLAAAYLVNYLPFINAEPTLCALAQIINATVAWDRYQDSQAVIDAYDELVIMLEDILTASPKNFIRAAGCTSPIPTLRHETCHNNGLTYDINDLWRVHGAELPTAYRRVTKAMYRSSVYTDQLMAIIATASLSPLLKSVSLSFGAPAIHLYLSIVTTPRIPRCCCPAFTQKATDTFAAFNNEIVRLIIEEKAKYM